MRYVSKIITSFRRFIAYRSFSTRGSLYKSPAPLAPWLAFCLAFAEKRARSAAPAVGRGNAAGFLFFLN